MFRLRQWHKKLLISEAIAGLIVIAAYHDIVDNRGIFLGGLVGTFVLSPGLKILGWPQDPFYPTVCLITAAIYTGVLFGLFTFGWWVTSRFLLRKLKSGAAPIGNNDLDRYLR